jgi:hypothetical protein
LQQVEAMTSLDDLEFMPFDSCEHAGGVLEISVDDQTSIFVERGDRPEEDGRMQASVIVSAIGARSIAVQ